jgi:glycine dehydrogenase subunit 2
MGIAKLGDLGVDVVHLNLHKTFSTPHGGGGPGSGPVAIKNTLAPFLPVPVIEKQGTDYRLSYDLPQSIGKVRAFYGNFGVAVKAYAYILSMGAEGLKKASEMAVLNANYLMARLKGYYHLPYDRRCMHDVSSRTGSEKAPCEHADIARVDRLWVSASTIISLGGEGALMMEPTKQRAREPRCFIEPDPDRQGN